MSASTWDEFADQAGHLVGYDISPVTQLGSPLGGMPLEMGKLAALVLLEELAGQQLPLELFETVETFGELYEWGVLVAERTAGER